MFNDTKTLLDVGAASITIATFFEYLPHATALVAFIWFVIRMLHAGLLYYRDAKKKD